MRKKLKIIERPKRGEKMANIAHSYNTELAVQQVKVLVASVVSLCNPMCNKRLSPMKT